MPETLWGYDHIASAYSVDPAKSKVLIYAQVRKNFPETAPGTLDAVLGWTQERDCICDILKSRG